MARLLPLRSEPETTDAGPRVLDLDDDETDEVFSALSSDTAREIYRAIHEEPSPPSEIADSVDSSIQNVRYHLENLEEAGLVTVVDTWYSSRGNEMSVYAPASDALVFAGDENEASRLRTALSRLLGGVAVLAMASLAVQATVTELLDGALTGGGADAGDPASGGGAGADGSADGADGGDGGDAIGDQSSGDDVATGGDGGDGGDGVDADATAEPQATDPSPATTDGGVEVYEEPTEVTETATEGAPDGNLTGANETITETTTTVVDAAANGGPDAAATLPPGALFFAGGLAVLVAGVAYWYWAGS